MKTYVIYALAKFTCTIEGKTYTPNRAMAGIIESGCCTGIKLIKCSEDFNPPVQKRIHIYFDENGKAVSYKLAE